MLGRMERAPTALHRVAAGALVALAFALLVVGGRRVLRAPVPEAPLEVAETPRSAARLHDVDDERSRAVGESAAAEEATPPTAENVARLTKARAQPLEEPLEKHPAYAIEGVVCSASGTYWKRVELEV